MQEDPDFEDSPGPGMQFGFFPKRKREPWEVPGRGRTGSLLPLGESFPVAGVRGRLNREEPEARRLAASDSPELRNLKRVRAGCGRVGACPGGGHFLIEGQGVLASDASFPHPEKSSSKDFPWVSLFTSL